VEVLSLSQGQFIYRTAAPLRLRGIATIRHRSSGAVCEIGASPSPPNDPKTNHFYFRGGFAVTVWF